MPDPTDPNAGFTPGLDTGATSTAPTYGSAAPPPADGTDFNMAPISSAGAAAIGVYSAFQAASQTKRLASFNATLGRLQESQIMAAAQTAETARGGMGTVMEGRANAALAAQGVGPGGTGAAVKTQLRSGSAMDQVMIEANARREAYAQEVRTRAGILEGAQAATKYKQQAAATILDTGAQEELEADPKYAGYRGRGVSY